MKEPDFNDPDFFEPEPHQSELEQLWNWLATQKGDHDELELNPENLNFSFGLSLGLSEKEMNELNDIDRTREESERDMENDKDF